MTCFARRQTCALVAIVLATQVQATQVAIRGHVGAGLAATVEEVKSKSVLELLQQGSFTSPSNTSSAETRGLSFAFVNSTTESGTAISGAVETQHEKAKQPEIIRHWGFSHEHPFWGSPMLTAILHSVSFAALIKSACMMSNVLFQVSPFPSMKQFKEKEDTGDADPAPFVAIAFGGSQWCFYGIFAYLVTGKSGFLILVYSNVLGALLGIYYVMTFQANCTRIGQISSLSMYYRIVSSLVLLQVGAMAVLPRERALFFSGLISSACSIAYSASVLVTLPVVIKKKCAASIPLPLCMASAVSNILWVICGVLLWDPWITFPNIFGTGGSLVCIGMWFYYGTEERPDTDCALLSHHKKDDEELVHSSDQEWGMQQEGYGACGETGGTCGETGGTF